MQLHMQLTIVTTRQVQLPRMHGCFPRSSDQATPATLRARSKTASSIAPVTRPVNVFC